MKLAQSSPSPSGPQAMYCLVCLFVCLSVGMEFGLVCFVRVGIGIDSVCVVFVCEFMHDNMDGEKDEGMERTHLDLSGAHEKGLNLCARKKVERAW